MFIRIVGVQGITNSSQHLHKYSLALDAFEHPVVVLVLHVLVEARVTPEGLGAILAVVDSTWGGQCQDCVINFETNPFLT